MSISQILDIKNPIELIRKNMSKFLIKNCFKEL